MRSHSGFWAGACLLLALAGCSKDPDEVKGHGTYSPILMGIGSNFEPAARGAPNQLTAKITNVNNLPLTYHWSVEAGTLTDSTQATATWTPPDTVATFNVTVSIEARDGDAYYFKTLTVPMSVDNQFIRWTRSDQVQFDPAPTPGGGVLYAGYRNATTGSSDLYRIDTPLGGPAQLTTGFFSVVSPSPRRDQVDIAFAGRVNSSDTRQTIYILPFAGGDPGVARVAVAPSSTQPILAAPRFARQGTRLAYVSDSITSGFPKVWWRDGANLATAPIVTVSTVLASPLYFNQYLSPSWGPDVNLDGNSDSMLTVAADFVGNITGLTKVWLPDTGSVWVDHPWLVSNQIQAPDWSPDGQYVTFAKTNTGTNERDIWIINRAATDISAAVRVTSGPADDSQPRFNDDGNSIFFVSNRVDRYGTGGIQGIERRGRNIWSVAQFDRP